MIQFYIYAPINLQNSTFGKRTQPIFFTIITGSSLRVIVILPWNEPNFTDVKKPGKRFYLILELIIYFLIISIIITLTWLL